LEGFAEAASESTMKAAGRNRDAFKMPSLHLRPRQGEGIAMPSGCFHEAFVALKAKAGEGRFCSKSAFPLPSPALAFYATKAS